jgi:hypothetical protein
MAMPHPPRPFSLDELIDELLAPAVETTALTEDADDQEKTPPAPAPSDY